jgi:hypothetical protein
MYRTLNLFFLLLILFFLWSTYKYYSSNKNLKAKEFNRINIEKILEKKTSKLITLPNNTNNVIEFNNSLTININNEKPRSFWNLLKIK